MRTLADFVFPSLSASPVSVPPNEQVKRAARTELRKKYGPVDEARHMYAIQKFDHDVRGVGPGPPVVPKSGA
jgi:hypothetical protein